MPCCFEVYKNVGEKPAHQLRIGRILSFFARLDGFERTLSDAFRIGPKYNYFLTSSLSYLLSVNKGNISRTYLISLYTRRRKKISSPAKSSSITKYFQQILYRASGGLEHLISPTLAVESCSSSSSCKAK